VVVIAVQAYFGVNGINYVRIVESEDVRILGSSLKNLKNVENAKNVVNAKNLVRVHNAEIAAIV